jgi:cell division transport system permease protein
MTEPTTQLLTRLTTVLDRLWKLRWAPIYTFNVGAYCWRCWRGRGLAWLATAAAVGAVLSLAAGAELFLVLSERSLDHQARSASEFQVFLDDRAGADQVAILQSRVAGLPGVRKVTYRSKAEALKLARQDSSLASISGNTASNPFPASLVVELNDPSAAGRVVAVVSRDPVTDHDVPSSYTPAQGQRLSAFLSMAQAFVVGIGAAALGVASVVALVLLRSEIRARRSELRILTLVGTPRPVIRLPLLVEAISLGMAGSLLATLTLLFAGGTVVPAVNGYLPFLQLGSATGAVQVISLTTLITSILALGGCSLLVRLPR